MTKCIKTWVKSKCILARVKSNLVPILQHWNRDCWKNHLHKVFLHWHNMVKHYAHGSLWYSHSWISIRTVNIDPVKLVTSTYVSTIGVFIHRLNCTSSKLAVQIEIHVWLYHSKPIIMLQTSKLGNLRPNTDCLAASNGVCTKISMAQFGQLLVKN